MNSLVDYDCDSEDSLEAEETISESKETIQSFALHLKRPHVHDHKLKLDQYKTPSGSEQLKTACPALSQASASLKRSQPNPGGLRPYVSKRQRMITSQPKSAPVLQTENSPELPTTNLRLLSEVSDRVQPFLGTKVVQGKLPKRVQHQLHGHHGPVNTVQWCPVPHLSHLLLSASMDKTFKCCTFYFLFLGQVVTRVDNTFKVSCLAFQPSDPALFLCGGFSSDVKAWDSRTCKMVRLYKAGIQQTLDILFLGEGKEFVTSSDVVSRDSADRTLIAWDFGTTAKISNQIYHERYTCPSLAMHPQEDSFVAQTNGNYIALFSAQKPYRMNKRKRYEGHKVEGYAVQCQWSSDGTILTTGSSTGSVHFYEFQSARCLLTLQAHQQACVCASYHPVIPAVVATCDWGGEIKIWNQQP